MQNQRQIKPKVGVDEEGLSEITEIPLPQSEATLAEIEKALKDKEYREEQKREQDREEERRLSRKSRGGCGC